MIETFMSLESKDKFTSIGLVITALLTLLNIVLTLYNNKKNLYANTILKERLDSLNKLKINSAKLLSIINAELRCMNKFEKSYKDIFELKSMVLYQFNYKNMEEQQKINEINYLIDLIFIISNFSSVSEIEKYCVEKKLYFFSKLHFESYSFERLQKLIYVKINLSLTEVEKILATHIKEEWEKVKRSS